MVSHPSFNVNFDMVSYPSYNVNFDMVSYPSFNVNFDMVSYPSYNVNFDLVSASSPGTWRRSAQSGHIEEPWEREVDDLVAWTAKLDQDNL